MRTNNPKQLIRKYFFLHPTAKLRVRQIERVVGIHLPSAIRYTKELKKDGILKSSTIAGVVVYSADRISPQFILEKRLFNIRQLVSCGLVKFLVEKAGNPPIIVFGSYSRGEDIENSDIDIYVETPLKRLPQVKRFEDILQRKTHIFAFKNITDVKNKELANNIVNGITLNGFVEVFR